MPPTGTYTYTCCNSLTRSSSTESVFACLYMANRHWQGCLLLCKPPHFELSAQLSLQERQTKANKTGNYEYDECCQPIMNSNGFVDAGYQEKQSVEWCTTSRREPNSEHRERPLSRGLSLMRHRLSICAKRLICAVHSVETERRVRRPLVQLQQAVHKLTLIFSSAGRAAAAKLPAATSTCKRLSYSTVRSQAGKKKTQRRVQACDCAWNPGRVPCHSASASRESGPAERTRRRRRVS